MASTRFRRLTDLFVRGKAVKMPDSTLLWVQVINSYEHDECLNDAQIGRARLVLALKEAGAERVKVEARIEERGQDSMAADLATRRAQAKISDFADDMRADPDWKERMQILQRTDWDTAAAPATEEELALVTRLNTEVVNELMRREKEEKEFEERRLQRLSDDEFIDEWVEHWIDQKGTSLAQMEYRLTELWYATRYCEARPNDDGELDHGPCNGHNERVFTTKQDARSAPTALQDLLREALDELNMVPRDPKGSGNKASSSDSSPTPSGQEESTPSTSTATPATPPGTSPSPSPTP